MDVSEKTTSKKRLIDADALLNEFLKRYTERERNRNLVFAACEIKQDFADMISDFPTVDAVEVVNGRWIGVDSSYWRWSHDGAHTVEHITFRCSECARKSIIKTNYCPNCGAKMDGGAE